MSRRVSLPGADELFRTTGGTALQASSPRRPANGEARVPAPAGESDQAAAEDAPQSVPAQGGDGEGAEHAAADAEQGSAGESRSRGAERSARGAGAGGGAQEGSAAAQPQSRKRGRAAARRPSGRERHDEKITVYVSAEELMDLEHARLVLRGEHGLAVDRGRIVREAVAVVLADLETRGDASILVRRLRGR
ncbi:hypothetical protein ACH4NS_26780 [Streptomyces mutabilis]|uniref:hypothetical protein n=1 Tax=Streptomyces TaxID=1883 RepID=UPI0015C7C6F8|nr:MULTISPECIES: hypothetical protein [unclassified Streptomyces]MDG9693874.1 hypothetical protein [Streptomyces sp. DH17]MDN3247835.1 hypothetical protein [Streptomyces sp. ZSW22]MDN3257166.1 hypothetical protein [Streptomyces sp. MA25(2023)]MDQ0388607.1 hypothetical protein [Streptomyces sp. DSM 42143]